MKIPTLTAVYVITFLTTTTAYPGMGNIMSEIKKRLPHPQVADPNNDGDAPSVMIGDLAKVGPTTAVGRSLYNILKRTESATSTDNSYKVPGPFGSKACAADTCCPWYWIAQDMKAAFTGSSGRCNAVARAAVRLGFHDAGTWSLPNANSGKDFGGADGSLILSGTEINRKENNGLQIIVKLAQAEQKKYGVGMADLIQFGANMAVVVCPLGPRIRSFVGRIDSSKAAPDGLLPDVNASPDSLINLFQDKTIGPHDLVALLGAHSTSQQFFVDPSKFGFAQDTTPGVWDVNYYNETFAPNAPNATSAKVFRFNSDTALAHHSKTENEWVSFMAAADGQHHWNEDYAQAYTRLSMLGVNNMNNLTECTKVMPDAKTSFGGSRTPLIDN